MKNIPARPNIQDNLFTSAEEQRGDLLLAFLGTSPSPVMVRRVFLANPLPARAALRLAIAPVNGEAARGTPAEATTTAWANTARRLESWQPLEGLEGLERLLRSAAGAAALAAVLGIEARQEYAHGAEFEAESTLAPLLGGLSCVLPLHEHLRAAQETAEASPSLSGSSLGNQLAQQMEEEASHTTVFVAGADNT